MDLQVGIYLYVYLLGLLCMLKHTQGRSTPGLIYNYLGLLCELKHTQGRSTPGLIYIYIYIYIPTCALHLVLHHSQNWLFDLETSEDAARKASD